MTTLEHTITSYVITYNYVFYTDKTAWLPWPQSTTTTYRKWVTTQWKCWPYIETLLPLCCRESGWHKCASTRLSW